MKKILIAIVSFFAFFITANASSPAGFIYDGPSEAKQGDTITYDLKVRDGNYFFVYSQDDEENFWSQEIEYDKHILQFVSFISDIPEISMSNNEAEEIVTLKIEKEALGPYSEGQVIGEISFKVLENSPLGEVKLYQPTGLEGIAGSNNPEIYKSINILENKALVVEEEINESKNKNTFENRALYIAVGSLSLLSLSLVITIIVLLVRNKNK